MAGISDSLVFWILASAFALLAILAWGSELRVWANSVGMLAERKRLRKIAQQLQDLEDILGAGSVPSSERWESLRTLPDPWGPLIFQSLSELRSAGASILPTMKRLRTLAQEHEATLLDAKARSAQALSQSAFCAILVPVFGSALFVLLPGVDEHPYQWSFACFCAIAVAGVGSAWMLKIAGSARWAGLSEDSRGWILAAQCAGERFLALVRAGTPADLSWTQAVELLRERAPELAIFWGSSVWNEPAVATGEKVAVARALIGLGGALRKTVQVSVMEGRPCGDRVETALLALRQEIRAQTDRELALLPTRALKPLFVFVAPAILGLLFFGLWLSWLQIASGGAFAF